MSNKASRFPVRSSRTARTAPDTPLPAKHVISNHVEGHPPADILGVWYGASFQEEGDDGGRRLLCRYVQRGLIQTIENVHLGAMLDEEATVLQNVPAGRNVQQRVPRLRPLVEERSLVNVRVHATGLDQERYDVTIAEL